MSRTIRNRKETKREGTFRKRNGMRRRDEIIDSMLLGPSDHLYGRRPLPPELAVRVLQVLR